ncbi:MAG: hypothetical protein PHN61_10920 [Methanothrix sp.]|nr:hypothetical protein [Methanothrix sp.]
MYFNPKPLELQTTKEILAEIFLAQSGEVEEMIQRRLEESGPEMCEVGRCPATFCQEEYPIDLSRINVIIEPRRVPHAGQCFRCDRETRAHHIFQARQALGLQAVLR